ncbi:MAG: DMT family transporter [Armatimonadetes bacterium]|nr:DMT family transporter [Armatimonadota bacterium]
MTTERPMTSRVRALSRIDLFMLFVVIVWGVNFTVVKWALEKMSPWSFNLARFTMSAVAMAVLLRVRDGGLRGISASDLLAMIGIGILGNTVYQALFIQGIAWTTAGNAVLFIAINPLWTALLSAGLGVDRLTARTWGGIVLAMAGAALVALGGHRPGSAGIQWLGDGLVLLAGICWSAYTVLSRALLARHSPLRLTGVGLIAGTAGIWATTMPAAFRQDWQVLTWADWSAIAFAGLGALVFCYTVWAEGVKHVGPARTAAYANLTPAVGLLASAWALGEPLGWMRVVGATLTIYGVYITRTSRPRSL